MAARIKKGVTLAGLHPLIILAYFIASQIYSEEGFTCTITSGVDGRHQRHSLHYKGLAIDLRTKFCYTNHPTREAKLNQLRLNIQLALGSNYQVFLENFNTPNEHIHIEYDPARLTL